MNKLVTLTNHKDNSTEQYRISWPVESLEKLAQDIAHCIALFTDYSFDYRDFASYKNTVKHLHLYKKAIFQDLEMSLTDIREGVSAVEIKQALNKPYLFKRINGLSYDLEECHKLTLPVDGTDSEALSRTLYNFITTTYFNDENGLHCLSETVSRDINSLAELLLIKRTLDLTYFEITILETN